MSNGPGLRVVRMTDSHLQDVFSLIDSENWGWEFAEVMEMHRIDSGSSVVALDGREVVGLVTCVDFGTFAFIVHVIVRKGWRRRGVGVRMVESALAELDSRGVRTVELHANPESTEFYDQFSFKSVERVSYMYRQPSHPEVVNRGDSPFSLNTLSPDDHGLMADVTAAATGYDRDEMLRAISKSPPDHAFSRREAGRTTSLVMSRVGKDIMGVGPWVMERPVKADASAMMHAFLSAVPSKRMDVLAPASSEVAIAAFEDCDFTLVKPGIVRTARSSERVERYSPSVLSLGHLAMI